MVDLSKRPYQFAKEPPFGYRIISNQSNARPGWCFTKDEWTWDPAERGVYDSEQEAIEACWNFAILNSQAAARIFMDKNQ